MFWFGGSDPIAELDAKIEEASSETIPNGEMDIAVGLEITDIIRSKKVPPKNAMRCLKKRLTKVYQNPNLLLSTLKVIDLCVKNCGAHFLAEINQKEFIDYLVDFIFKVHYNTKDYKVYSSEAKYKIGNTILKYIKEWNLCLMDVTQTKYLDRAYQLLLLQGYDFPEVDSLLLQSASTFADSRAPPDWIDGNECMICYNPFSVMNRKHHCRACGGVFCQTHSSNNIPLPALGILQPVRVCDDCYQIHKSKTSDGTKKSTSRKPLPKEPTNPVESEEDEQLRKAIELSLQESQGSSTNYAPPPTAPPAPKPTEPSAVSDEDMDDDMKAAIEASLKEYKQEQSYRQPEPLLGYSQYPSQPSASNQLYSESQLEFYQNSLPFDPSAYSQPPAQETQPEFYRQQPQHTFNQTNSSNPVLTAQHTQPQGELSPQRTHVEDLTEEEEELINLYLQLINGVKQDRSKQANILYDQDLNDLHARVIRLKPKLNRSLRLAIEKHDTFMEMNNKISTITRLYDQFLEDKLNQAYNRHSISSPQFSPVQSYGMPPQGTGSQPFQAYTGQLSGQHTGQHTGQHPAAPVETSPIMSRQSTASGQGSVAQHTGSYSVKRQGTGYPQHNFGQPYPPPPSLSIPYPMDLSAMQETPSQQSEAYDHQSSAFLNTSFPTYPSQPDLESEDVPDAPKTNGSATRNTGFYPTEIPLDNSDGESTTSVASRYPPVAAGEGFEVQEPVAAHEHASERYPTIAQIEQKEQGNIEAEVSIQPSEIKRPKSEPEPLIEL